MGEQSKPKQIKCENESKYKEFIVDQTRAITRAIAVLLLVVCFFFCFFKAFAEENGFVGELKHWDIPFWSQKQREHLFRFEQETSYVVLFFVCHRNVLLLCLSITDMSWMLVTKMVFAQAWREFSRFGYFGFPLSLKTILNSNRDLKW